jgi:hypothetical protein
MKRMLIVMLVAFVLLLYGCTGGLQNRQTPTQSPSNPNQTQSRAGPTSPQTNQSGGHIENASNTFTNSTYHFSVNYPIGWNVTEGPWGTFNKVYGTDVKFIGPTEGGFTHNCDLTTYSVPFNQTLEGKVKEMDSTYRAYPGLFKNYEIVSESKITVGGQQAHETILTYTMASEPEVNLPAADYKVQQVIVIRNGTVYVIDCLASPPLFDKYEPYFESIITSFRFID